MKDLACLASLCANRPLPSAPSPSLLDPRDRKHFYYIVNDPRLGFAYCHVLYIYSPTDKLPGCMGKLEVGEGDLFLQPTAHFCLLYTAAAHRSVAHQRALEAQNDAIAGGLAVTKKQRTEAVYAI